MGMNNLKHVGFIYALYVEKEFVKYFDTIKSAKAFSEKFYKSLSVFINPIAYFKFNNGDTA